MTLASYNELLLIQFSALHFSPHFLLAILPVLERGKENFLCCANDTSRSGHRTLPMEENGAIG